MLFHGVFVFKRFLCDTFHIFDFPFQVLRCIRLTEEDTTSSSRVYIKNLLLELAEFLGLSKLNNRLTDPYVTNFSHSNRT